jgi:hypothetical protein
MIYSVGKVLRTAKQGRVTSNPLDLDQGRLSRVEVGKRPDRACRKAAHKVHLALSLGL